MKFLIDNQLPVALAIFLRGLGHDCIHVMDAGMDESTDQTLWEFCLRDNRVLVSKDQDFVFLANLPGDAGRLLWMRLGNCRNEALLQAVGKALPKILAAFDGGQCIVELR